MIRGILRSYIIGDAKMGFAKPDTSASDKANALLEKQIHEQQLELKRKRDELFKERLGIIKSESGPSYTPDVKKPPRPSPSPKSGNMAGGMSPVGRSLV